MRPMEFVRKTSVHAWRQAMSKHCESTHKVAQCVSILAKTGLDGALAISSLCDPSTVYCIDTYLAQQSEIIRLVNANKNVLENYRELAFLDDFAMTLTPDLEAPVPPSKHLVLAQRLRHASLAVRAQRSKPSQIAEELVQDLELTRRLLAQSDHLIYKMTAAVMVVRSLHLISQISDAWPKIAESVAEHPAMISAITAQELSLASSLCSEFRLLSSVFLRRDQVAGIADIDSVALGTLSTLAYKPNATVNLAFADLNGTLEKLDALAPDEFGKRFAKHAAERASNQRPGALDHFLTWPWNPIGHILVQVARPQYERWYTRLYDLEGLRRIVAMKLLVVKHALGDEQIKQIVADRIDGLSDPYRDAPLVVNFDRRTLSFQALSEMGSIFNE